MKRNILIADSGSTKTSWMYIDSTGHRHPFETQGINPVRDSEAEMEKTLGKKWTTQSDEEVCPREVFFYGAGCTPPYSETIKSVLARRFPDTHIHVESDLLGAAHALCGHSEGVACILGTGSNSCLYDGERIVENVSPLGYILGDEGSGAVLGRNLVSDLLKGQLSNKLQNDFVQETGLTRVTIINKVYREPQPNRFLASLVPFLGRHREEEEVHRFLVENFRRFFHRNVALYQRTNLPVHFVGGVAHSYRKELDEAAQLEGFSIGNILPKPIEALTNYLTGEQNDKTECNVL